MRTPVETVNGSGWERAALWLSRIFHPFLITIPTLALAIYLNGSSLREALQWTAVTIGVVIAPAFLFIAYHVRTARFSDWTVSIREQRHGLYFVGGVCLLLLLAILFYFDAPRIIQACLLAAVAANGISALVNRITKISVHAAAMAGCSTVLFTVWPPLGVGLGVMTLIVGWARIRLKQHSAGQVLLGWMVAVACVGIVFALYL